MNLKVSKLIPWLPGVITVAVAAGFCIAYGVCGGSDVTMYLQLLASSLLPFAVPLYTLVTKQPLTAVLSVLAAVFVFCASFLGSGLEFYDKFLCWDWIMHGAFAFIASLAIFIFCVRGRSGKANVLGCVLIVLLATLGIAAIWEIWEYIADSITGADSQRVAESIALGKSPLADTMEDIMIAVAGSALFFIALLADKFCGYKVCRRLCGFSGFGPVKRGSALDDGQE